MDKNIDSISSSHGISINERKSIYITGVNKIINFDYEEFLLDTSMGHLAIKGEELELLRLDTKDGIVSIKGNIISFCYIDDYKTKKSKNNIIDKLFK